MAVPTRDAGYVRVGRSPLTRAGRVRQWLGAVQGGQGACRVSSPPACTWILRLPYHAPTTDHDAETGAIVAVLEAAGLITVEVRADGEESYVLTPDGERVAR